MLARPFGTKSDRRVNPCEGASPSLLDEIGHEENERDRHVGLFFSGITGVNSRGGP